MHLFLFSIIAICIAGSRTQEIAIGTEYLRAYVNGSLSSESANNAQVPVLPPVGVFVVESASSTTDKAVTTSTAAPDAVKDDHSETAADDDKKKVFDHEHKSHHEHDATISVDVHNILDLFKQLLQESEERILAAIHHHDHHTATAVPVVKSYRTADR